MPLFPTRDVVVFPYQKLKLFVGRAKTIEALRRAMQGNGEMILAGQRSARIENPGSDDIHRVGTICVVSELETLPDQSVRALLEGKIRGRIESFSETDSCFIVQVTPLCDESNLIGPASALNTALKQVFINNAHYNESRDVSELVVALEDDAQLTDIVASEIKEMTISKRQALLETSRPRQRMIDLIEFLSQSTTDEAKEEWARFSFRPRLSHVFLRPRQRRNQL